MVVMVVAHQASRRFLAAGCLPCFVGGHSAGCRNPMTTVSRMSFAQHFSRHTLFPRTRLVAAACALLLTVGQLPLAALAQAGAAANGAHPPAAEAQAVAPVQTGFPAPPPLAARSFLLIDISSGNQILAGKDMDAVMEPASLTKLMTAYIVFDALKNGKITLEQTFGVSEKAWKMVGSRMFIKPNTQVSVEDLLKGMIVQSGNDATMALAEGLFGSEEAFVARMNEVAQQLGMRNTSYRNPEGLTAEGHTTTARDMALLSTRLMSDFPQYVHYYAIKEYRYPGTPATNAANRNLLLFRDASVDGLKTGHTAAAGYNLIATAKRPTAAQPQGRRLLAIVFGTANEAARANETMKLLNWGYGAFEDVQLLQAGQSALQVRVWKGQINKLDLGSAHDVFVTVPVGQGGNITREAVAQGGKIIAPVEAEQPLGTLTASLNGQPVAAVPLHALKAVPQAGFFGRLWDAFLMLFSK